MRFEELARGCFQVPERYADIEVSGLTSDSREVRPGFVFVAVPGEKTDGHLYAQKAEESGAVAIVGQRTRSDLRMRSQTALSPRIPYLSVPDSRQALGRLAAALYGTDTAGLTIAGVTGTKGKTTTAWILDSIFRGAGKVSALFGTVHNRIADRTFPSENTTPGCLQVHRHLEDLVKQGGTHAVLEVSSHGILQRRLEGVRFRCGIFTNVDPEHLDYHKTFENYVETKISFFAGLDPSAFAVLPREQPVSKTIASRTRASVSWYGADSQDGVEQLRMTPEGLSFRWKGIPVRSPLWGHHNLVNVLGAMTAAECAGLGRAEISRGVETAVAPPGRLEEIASGLPFHVFVDYAHTDGSLGTVLSALKEVTSGRLITIFGCGGDRDRSKRPRMGRVAEKWSDQVVVTSDNPRSEDPLRIIEDIRTGFRRPEEAVFEVDRRAAIALGIRMARADDTVLIAGKGHETYQEIQGIKVHFDDREVARGFLREVHED